MRWVAFVDVRESMVWTFDGIDLSRQARHYARAPNLQFQLSLSFFHFHCALSRGVKMLVPIGQMRTATRTIPNELAYTGPVNTFGDSYSGVESQPQLTPRECGA